MRLLVDNNILIQILAPNATGLRDPDSDEELDYIAERAIEFVAQVESKGAVIVIPAPVLSEFLIGIEKEKFQEFLDILNGNACFELADFDTAAAIECAQLPDRKELAQISPREVASKLKYDRQIVSIALAANVGEIWSHDKSLRKLAVFKGLTVKSLVDIKVPPTQLSLPEG